jgi:hypothetical protein
VLAEEHLRDASLFVRVNAVRAATVYAAAVRVVNAYLLAITANSLARYKIMCSAARTYQFVRDWRAARTQPRTDIE